VIGVRRSTIPSYARAPRDLIAARRLPVAPLAKVRRAGYTGSSKVSKRYNRGMRMASLFFAVALLYGPALRAQDQSLVEPGDILTVKLLSPKLAAPISRTVTVTPDGNLKPPLLRGIRPIENIISVGGMGFDDVAQKLDESYGVLKKLRDFQIVIERGTVAQLLSQ
jgi:hypothetical protein